MMRHFLFAAALLYAGHAAAIEPNAADQAAIAKVVNSYPEFVMQRDRKGFEGLILDKDVPFSSISANKTVADSSSLRNYADFERAIFDGDASFRQQFSDIKIDRVGPIAQVSLNFTVQRLDGKSPSYKGWKILQLVKSNGDWKIASELYTFDLD